MPATRRRRHSRKQTVAGRIMKPIDVRSMKDLTEMQKRIAAGPITFVLVYADWCGHCHSYKPLFEKASQSKNRSVQVVSLNEQMVPAANTHMSQNVKTSEPINVEGYPSVIVVNNKGEKVSELNTSIRKPEQIKSAMEKSGNAVSNKQNSQQQQEQQQTISERTPEFEAPVEDSLTNSAMPISPPSQEEEKTNSLIPVQQGGSLYGSMAAAAYQLAPAAALMGISHLMKRRSKKQKKTVKRRR
jgi:thiol-disulfide isomerase/thioredoxin